MKACVLSCILLMVFCVGHAQNDCPTGFIRRYNSCYYFGRSRLSWFDADQYCTHRKVNDYNTHLVAVETQDEQTWLINIINGDSELRNNDWWIGLDQVDRKRGWVWASTGQRLIWSNWASGQPDNSGKCAVSWANQGHRWDDIDCEGSRRYFVCELELF